MNNSQQQPVILSILEIGGYPDFSKLYESLGYQVVCMESMRKALKYIKKHDVDVIVAEFNFQSDFRDRSSQLETLMASIAQKPDVRVIVFYDKEQMMQFRRVRDQYDFFATISYPVEAENIIPLIRLK